MDFPQETVFVASGPDFTPVVTGTEPGDAERQLAELLREHGPESMTVYVQFPDGRLIELFGQTVHTGRDDIAKYYVTTFTQTRAFQKPLEIQVGWDS